MTKWKEPEHITLSQIIHLKTIPKERKSILEETDRFRGIYYTYMPTIYCL